MRWPLLAMVLLAGVAHAQGFRRTTITARDGSDKCLYWNHRDISWVIDAAGSSKTPGDSEFVAVETAFASWQTLSNTCSDFALSEGPRATSVATGKGTQSENIVTFREKLCTTDVPPSDSCNSDGSCANLYKCWDHGDLTIALTTNTYSVTTAVIVDSDIELNAAPHAPGDPFLFTTISAPPCSPSAQTTSCVATDVQNTVTHEIGHLFGFDHVDDEQSTMAATSDIGDLQKRTIDRGTADGFCLTYPRDQPSTPCDELAQLRRKVIARGVGTPGLQSIGCSQAMGTEGPVLLGLWAALSVRRRRAR